MPGSKLDREDLLRWQASWRAVERLDRAERRDRPPDPATTIALSLSLIDMAARMHGWPRKRDRREEEEAQRLNRVWRRLREAFNTS